MLHPALAQALAAAHLEDLQRAAARRHTIRLARQAARGSRRPVDEADRRARNRDRLDVQARRASSLMPEEPPRCRGMYRRRTGARVTGFTRDCVHAPGLAPTTTTSAPWLASSIAAARPFPRVAAMHEVERLLTARNVQITSVDPEHSDAQYCLQEYVAELNRRSPRGFDPSAGVTALPREVRPPAGEFFVAYLYGEAVGCGAVKHHADAPAEIKRMWIAPRVRGLGLSRL